MNRRNFFRLAAGAGAALLLPEFVLPVKAAEPERVPITLTWMQHTYGSLWYGHQQPTKIVFSLSRWEEVRDNIRHRDRIVYRTPETKVISFRFCGSDVLWDKNVDDDTAVFINENMPNDHRFNRKAHIGDFWNYDVATGKLKIEKHP